MPTSTVNITETSIPTFTATNSTRFVVTAATAYSGPATSGYPVSSSLTLGAAVSYLGKKEGSFAFIEYTLSGTQKTRAYIIDTNLGTAPPSGLYKSVIDSFNVTTNAKYQPVNGTTFCNIFAQDVMNAMGEALPTGGCTSMLNYLSSNVDAHWRSVSAVDAQARANAGYGTIGITSDHVVVIYPHGNTATTVSDLYMSMAGYACFNDTRITYAWTSANLPSVKFYSYYF